MIPNLFTGIFGSIEFDERFIKHRFISSRIALVVGYLVMAVYINYEYLANEILRWDLVVILGMMALTKVTAVLPNNRVNGFISWKNTSFSRQDAKSAREFISRCLCENKNQISIFSRQAAKIARELVSLRLCENKENTSILRPAIRKRM